MAHQEVCYRAEAKAWGAKTRDTPRDISGHAKAMRDLEMASRRLFGTTDRLTAVQKKIRILRSEATAQERIRTQEEMFA